MFTANKTILWFTKDTKTLVEIASNGTIKNQQVITSVEEETSFTQKIDAVLLDNSFVYSIKLERQQVQPKDQDIRKKSEELIPEDIEHIPWGVYKTAEDTYIMAVTSRFLQEVSKILSSQQSKKVLIIPESMISAQSVTQLTPVLGKTLVDIIQNNISPLTFHMPQKQKTEDTATIESEQAPEDIEKQTATKPHNNRLIYLLAFMLISTLVFGGTWYWKQNQQTEEKAEVPISQSAEAQSTISPTQVSSQATSPTLSKQDYSIRILNGSGEAGAAGAVEDILDKEGYKVVDSGNAESFAYEDTEIQAKSTVPEGFIEGLDKVLEKSYSVNIGSELQEGEDVDIIIIVGKTL